MAVLMGLEPWEQPPPADRCKLRLRDGSTAEVNINFEVGVWPSGPRRMVQVHVRQRA